MLQLINVCIHIYFIIDLIHLTILKPVKPFYYEKLNFLVLLNITKISKNQIIDYKIKTIMFACKLTIL